VDYSSELLKYEASKHQRISTGQQTPAHESNLLQAKKIPLIIQLRPQTAVHAMPKNRSLCKGLDFVFAKLSMAYLSIVPYLVPLENFFYYFHPILMQY
jgi:hypothetical protein